MYGSPTVGSIAQPSRKYFPGRDGLIGENQGCSTQADRSFSLPFLLDVRHEPLDHPIEGDKAYQVALFGALFDREYLPYLVGLHKGPLIHV